MEPVLRERNSREGSKQQQGCTSSEFFQTGRVAFLLLFVLEEASSTVAEMLRF